MLLVQSVYATRFGHTDCAQDNQNTYHKFTKLIKFVVADGSRYVSFNTVDVIQMCNLSLEFCLLRKLCYTGVLISP